MTEAELHRELLAEQAWVRRVARLIAGDASLADDIAQDTWAVSERAPAERRQLWLGRVVKNLVRMRRRSAMRRERYESVAELPSAATPDELVARMEAQRAVSGAVLALAEPYRSTILMRFVEELSSAEIARKLEIPEGTVRRRLKVALDRLRGELSDDDGRRSLAVVMLGGRSTPTYVTASVAIAMAAIAVAAIAVATIAIIIIARRSADPGDLSAHDAPAVATLSAAPITRPSSPSPSPSIRPATTLSSSCESTMAGQVRDALGPIGGVHVSTSDHAVETDDDGHYTICMHPMRSVVRIAAPGYGAIEDDRIHPTGDLDRDFILVPESPISGRVVDPSGAPIADAEVVARADRSERHAALAAGRARTGPDGAFRITGIAPGRFEVVATARDRSARAIAESARTVELVIDPATPRVVAPPTATIAGHVLRHGTPVRGAEVWCLTSETFATTGEDGSFVLGGVAPGQCRLTATAGDASSELVVVNTVAGERRVVELDASHASSISGHVVDARGQPVRGVYVIAMSGDGDDGGDSLSDARGAFMITTLGPAEYAMTVYPSASLGIAFPGTRAHVTVPTDDSAIANVQIAIDDRRVAIHGRIVDDSGTPIPDVFVEASHGSSLAPPSTRTALDGTFTIGNLVAGTYTLRARAGDGRHGERLDVVAGSGDQTLTLTR